MSCGCDANILHLAIDARVTSERDGAAAVTWSDPSTWNQLAGASAIEVFALILHREGTPTLTLVAERALDGRTFMPLDRVADACTWDANADPTPVRIPLTRDEAAPLVRLGLQVSGSGGVQAAVRLSLVVVVYRDVQQAVRAATSMATLAGVDTAVADATAGTDTLVDTTYCGSVAVTLRATSVTGTLDIELRTSDDGSNWIAVPGATMQLTTSAKHKVTGALAAAGLLRYVRLYTAAANGGSATGVEAAVWLRA